MKESWLEKLKELFKDYIENYGNDTKVREEENYILDTWIEFVYWSRVYLYETIISKKFWFIKRLVENDKIEKKKIDTRLVRYVDSHYDEEWNWVENSYEDYELYDVLLMLLSISDTPIDDLILYLK